MYRLTITGAHAMLTVAPRGGYADLLRVVQAMRQAGVEHVTVQADDGCCCAGDREAVDELLYDVGFDVE